MAAASNTQESSDDKNPAEELESEVSSNDNKIKLEDLKVIDLKNELEKRALDKNGVKSVLIERLKSAILEEGGDPDNFSFEISSDSNPNKNLIKKKRVESVDTKVEAVDTKVEAVDTKVESVSTKVESVGTKVESVDTKVESVDTKVESVDTKVESVDTKVESLDTKVESVDTKVESVDTKVESVDTNGSVDASDKLTIHEEKTDVTLQLLIDEEEAQLNEDESLIDIPKQMDLEIKIEDTIQIDSQLSCSKEKLISCNSIDKSHSPTKNSKSPNEDNKEKKVIKTIQGKNSEGISNVSPKVLKVIGKSDKLKSATVLAKSLWIKGLPDATRAADLKALFSKQGRVLSVKIVKSAKQTPAKCYGFVTMATSKDATKAIQNLHHTELNGRIISVERTQNEPGTLLKKSESKLLTLTAAKKQVVKKEISVLKQAVPAEKKEVKSDFKETMKQESGDGSKPSTEESGKKRDEKLNSAEKLRMKEKDRKSREYKDKERDLHRPVRKPPVFRSRVFGYNDRPHYTGFKHPFGRKPFAGRISFGSTFRPRPSLIALQKLREERFQKERFRERREAERRRAEERHRYIERRQREEAYRLEREKERLRIERELLERERAEILKLEREKQRLERERLEREREDLRRQADLRRSTKRPFSRVDREPDLLWDERKKPNTRYDSRASFHAESSSNSRFEYSPRERTSYNREYERHADRFNTQKHLDVLHRPDFDRDARREVTIRTRDERQLFNRSDFRDRDNRRSFSSRERERHSSSRRETARDDWKHDRRVHERIVSPSSSSAQRRMTYY